MFKIDDVVFYENAGLCKVEGIGTPDFVRSSDEYYKLQTLDNIGNTIYVKVKNEQTMRYTISKSEAMEYMQSMHDIEGIYHENSKARDREFLTILRSGDWMDCLSVYKGIQQMKEKRATEGKQLNTSDERNLARADRIICGEFSIALETTVQDIREQLNKYCK
jgi:CarD family transcriptional regulator